MAVGSGHKCKFALGSTVIGSITKWGVNGITNKMHDASVFLDEFDKYCYGRGNGGKISISGYLDESDTGQLALQTVWIAKTTLSTTTTNDPRLYYDASGYFELLTGQSPVVCALIEELTFGEADANSGLVAFACTMQVSGGYFVKH